jgi:mannosyltransferase OCH1-like enzyme
MMDKTRSGSMKGILKRAFKKRDLLPKIICYIMIKFGYSNMALQTYQIRYHKYKKLYKKYSKVLNNIEYPESKKLGTINNNVWVCWFQGMENAPEIVKKCNESLHRHLPDKNIHIITEKNMFEYVDFPDYIITKWKNGIISYTHLSDILRTLLLIKYGGVWVDATTFFTGDIPSYVYRNKLFLLQFKTRDDLAIKVNNWFIYAESDNRTLKIVRDLLFAYWKKENYLSEYFLWHLFVQMTFTKYPEDYNSIDYVSETMAHCLYYNMFKKYDEEYWNQIKRCSNIHKLSYYLFKIPEDIQGTFYEYFLDGRLE